MNETIGSDHLAEAPNAEPSQHDHDKLLDIGLKIIAEDDSPGAHEDYRRERETRKAYANGDKEFKDADRAAEFHARWEKIRNTVAHEEQARQSSARQERFAQEAQQYGLENVEDHIRHAEAVGEDRAMAFMDERSLPGITDYCNQTAAIHGPLAPHVVDLVRQSPYRTQLLKECCDYPENISDLNSLHPQDVMRRIAAAEVIFQTRGQQQNAPRQSTAPRPVSTVKGRSSSNGKTPEEMSNDEYRAWRTKGRR